MAKYSKYVPQKRIKKTRNPLWRGIGCLLMIAVPAISYWIALYFLKLAKGNEFVPASLLGHFQIPEWSRQISAIASIFVFFGSFEDFWAKIIFFLVTLLLLSGLISLMYSVMYQIFGPARYSELDSPPENRRAREYKR